MQAIFDNTYACVVLPVMGWDAEIERDQYESIQNDHRHR